MSLSCRLGSRRGASVWLAAPLTLWTTSTSALALTWFALRRSNSLSGSPARDADGINNRLGWLLLFSLPCLELRNMVSSCSYRFNCCSRTPMTFVKQLTCIVLCRTISADDSTSLSGWLSSLLSCLAMLAVSSAVGR